MLLPIESLISRDDALRLRAELEKGEWLDGRSTAGWIAASAKANLQLDEKSQLSQQLARVITDAIKRHPLFVSAALPARIMPPRFNCYQNGGHYGLHTDASIMTLPDGKPLRTDVSATLFLSDADEYDGGELAIETRYGAHEIKLNAGDLVLYPSDSLHEVRPVTRGRRVAAFFWVQSMVKEAHRREMLFELDQSVQTLGKEHGPQHHEVRRLSALYHNLMREWSVL